MAATVTQSAHDGEAARRDSGLLFGLLRRLTDEISTLFHQEVNLAAAELHHSFTNLVAAGSIAVAGAILFAGLLALLAASVLGLAEVMPAWLAALIVGLAAGSIGWLLVRVARPKLDSTALLPRHSLESTQEDKDVLTRKSHA